MESGFLKVLNDPSLLARNLELLLLKKRGRFVLNLGSTRTSDLDGISAAGANGRERRLTPSIDADLLVSGGTRSGETLPVSPVGIVSPVVISHACLKLLDMTPTIVDCGTFRAPVHSDFTAGTLVANCVSTGEAMPFTHVEQLFSRGLGFADQLDGADFVTLGECVPGGTTTALAVLKGLGIAADRLVSSSLTAFSDKRLEIVDSGLKRGLKSELKHAGICAQHPLQVVAAVGDPMQAFVAGLTMAASQTMPVVLAGGSQMLAIFHLCNEIAKATEIPFNSANVFVVTTKWIACDANSNTPRLSHLLKAPFFAAAPDFHLSKFAGLRAYEDGHVKEGVGAGGLMAMARYGLQLSNAELMSAIDASYALLAGASINTSFTGVSV